MDPRREGEEEEKKKASSRSEESVKTTTKLRVFFLPFFASGHMIPMADLAALFSLRPDVEPTLCLTPANADLLRPSLPSSVNVLLYPFPSDQCGLPPGLENLSSVPAEQDWRLYKAVGLSRSAHERLLRDHSPDAVVADVPFSWTTDIANDIGIVRITWHAVGVFPQLVMNSLYDHHRAEAEADNNNNNNVAVTVKNLPGPTITMPRTELPEFVRSVDHMTEAWPTMKKAQLNCFGVIVNTCYEFEPEYCDRYRETDCRRAWFVGPVALARGENVDAATEKGGDEQCLRWLDGKEEGSVVFVCFGSWCRFSDEQLAEIAVGLEESNRPFLWVVRTGGMERWVPEGWAGRVGGRGMVAEGWAPQVAILQHAAVGAFLTHGGWNSVLESAAAGVPMLTWPLTFEQFINERLVVEVWGAGRRVFDGARSTREEEKVLVPAGAITRAISQFVEGEGGAASAAAKEMASVAKAAVAAEGGSSWKDLNRLIDELRKVRNK